MGEIITLFLVGLACKIFFDNFFKKLDNISRRKMLLERENEKKEEK
jgi:hypothetical protein